MKQIILVVVGAVCLAQPLQSFSPISLVRQHSRSEVSIPTALRKRSGAVGDSEHYTFADVTKNHLNEEETRPDQFRRRLFLRRSLHTLTLLGVQSGTANARGLARFPCKEPLLNTYHFMRAGTSLLEEENIWSTNPLFLTNREAALSELGDVQVRNACRFLKSQDITPTVVRYSLAAASVDSANIVGEELKVGRDRLVPEFNYMDPRAIGAWDFAALNETVAAVWAMDRNEAGPYGKGGRPPPNEDGTPAETLSDQVVRLTNLISVLETLYSGDVILLIFPDGTGPALLSCLIGGIPLNRVHEFNYEPGEVRCNVDYSSMNLMSSQQPPQVYSDVIERGQKQLLYLRENPDMKMNIKDLKYEAEEKLEAQKKSEADAKKKKESETLLKEEKRLRVTNEFNNSLGTEVGLGAAALITGGIGIAASTASSIEANSTQIKQNSTDPIIIGSEVEELEVTDVSDEDVEIFMAASSMTQQSDQIKIEVVPETKCDGISQSESPLESMQSDCDYDDGWLGTITDILNDDDEPIDKDEV